MAALPVPEQNERLMRLISRVDDLAVLPHVVFKVLELTSTDEVPPSDLEKAITVDPGFSSKVLVLANSAAFGLPRKVTSIKESILFLGFRTIRSIAMTVGVFDLFVGKTDRESLRRREWWRHSIDCAVCARFIAKRTDKVPPEDAYTAGLLHLIGKTILDRIGGDDYAKIEALEGYGIADYVGERKLYGCDHTEVAVGAAMRWGLPPALQSGLAYLTPAAANDPYGALRACTAISTHLAVLAKNGQDDGAAQAMPAWALERLGFTKEAIGELVEECSQAISTAELRF